MGCGGGSVGGTLVGGTLVGGTLVGGILVGGTLVGGTGVLVGGTRVAVGGTGVLVAGTRVVVGGTRLGVVVAVPGFGVRVRVTVGVSVGVGETPGVAEDATSGSTVLAGVVDVAGSNPGCPVTDAVIVWSSTAKAFCGDGVSVKMFADGPDPWLATSAPIPIMPRTSSSMTSSRRRRGCFSGITGCSFGVLVSSAPEKVPTVSVFALCGILRYGVSPPSGKNGVGCDDRMSVLVRAALLVASANASTNAVADS